MQIPIELQLQRAIARAEKAAADCEKMIETFRIMLEKADDETLVKAAAVNDELFPAFDNNTHHYTVGERFVRNGSVYTVLQNHISQPSWSPDNAPSLYKCIGNADTMAQGGISDFVQPIGDADAYKIGDHVMWEGMEYESVINGNVWSPSSYPQGWRAVK